MQRKSGSYDNQHGEDKSSEQSRLPQVALERAQGPMPAVGANVTPQSDVVRDRGAVPTNDATLSFGSKDVISSGWIPETPYDAELRRVAGGVGSERLTSSAPTVLGTPLIGVPDGSEGTWNMQDIIRGGRK